jgi:hypothetical protein
VRRGSGIAGSGGWEIARYDYSLTDQGREALAQIVGQLQDAEGIRAAIGRVLAAGDNDYVDLSFAAKTDWILESEHGAMTPEGIAKAATRFNWNVSGTDVQKAATFLSNLGLVQLSPSVAV